MAGINLDYSLGDKAMQDVPKSVWQVLPAHKAWLANSIASSAKSRAGIGDVMGMAASGMTLDDQDAINLDELIKNKAEELAQASAGLSDAKWREQQDALAAELQHQVQPAHRPDLQMPNTAQAVVSGLGSLLFPQMAGQIASAPFAHGIQAQEQGYQLDQQRAADEQRSHQQKLNWLDRLSDNERMAYERHAQRVDRLAGELDRLMGQKEIRADKRKAQAATDLRGAYTAFSSANQPGEAKIAAERYNAMARLYGADQYIIPDADIAAREEVLQHIQVNADTKVQNQTNNVDSQIAARNMKADQWERQFQHRLDQDEIKKQHWEKEFGFKQTKGENDLEYKKAVLDARIAKGFDHDLDGSQARAIAKARRSYAFQLQKKIDEVQGQIERTGLPYKYDIDGMTLDQRAAILADPASKKLYGLQKLKRYYESLRDKYDAPEVGDGGTAPVGGGTALSDFVRKHNKPVSGPIGKSRKVKAPGGGTITVERIK